MSDIFFGTIYIVGAIAIFSFGIGFYLNLFIFYSAEKDKYQFFPILNPLSFSTYELMFNSMFKMKWKVEGENEKLKRISNRLRRFSGIMLLITIVVIIFSLIIE